MLSVFVPQVESFGLRVIVHFHGIYCCPLVLLNPPHRYPAKFGYVLLCSPCLFGKILFSMQDKLVNNKQTHCLKQIFSATITPVDKRCEMVINLLINPVGC